jgi:hypothetical protein
MAYLPNLYRVIKVFLLGSSALIFFWRIYSNMAAIFLGFRKIRQMSRGGSEEYLEEGEYTNEPTDSELL